MKHLQRQAKQRSLAFLSSAAARAMAARAPGRRRPLPVAGRPEVQPAGPAGRVPGVCRYRQAAEPAGRCARPAAGGRRRQDGLVAGDRSPDGTARRQSAHRDHDRRRDRRFAPLCQCAATDGLSGAGAERALQRWQSSHAAASPRPATVMCVVSWWKPPGPIVIRHARRPACSGAPSAPRRQCRTSRGKRRSACGTLPERMEGRSKLEGAGLHCRGPRIGRVHLGDWPSIAAASDSGRGAIVMTAQCVGSRRGNGGRTLERTMRRPATA